MSRKKAIRELQKLAEGDIEVFRKLQQGADEDVSLTLPEGTDW